MLEIISTLSPAKVSAIKEYLNQLDNNLTKDVSSYAPGRMRYWINKEWDLKNKTFKPALIDEKIWNYCKAIYPEADLGLITKGGGIDWHRDDSYADYIAITINLGKCQWGYRACYPGYTWVREQNEQAPKQILDLEGGEIIRFNCKNPHAAINPANDRYSINLWKIKQR